MGIVVLGAVFVDIKGYPIHGFVPSEMNNGYVRQVHGGVSRNVTEDIANLELRPCYISLVDNTALGKDVVRKLARHKVDTRYIQSTPNGMGTWLAIFNAGGDVFASVSKRPDLSPIEDIIDLHGDEIFSSCDSIVLEIDMDAPIVKKVYQYAEKYGKKVYALVSNMTIAAARRDYIRRTDCFICNRDEAGILFAEDFSSLSTAEMEAVLTARVSQADIPAMVVTMGADGSVYAGKDGTHGHCPAINVEVTDTTGAGDAFFAGTAVGLTYGKTLPEACRIGTKLAASVVRIPENVCPRFNPEEFGITLPR